MTKPWPRLEYDDVINQHRNIIYSKRNKILDSGNIDQDIHEMVTHQVQSFVDATLAKSVEINYEQLIKKVNEFTGVTLIRDGTDSNDITAISDKNELSRYIGNIASSELDTIKNKAPSTENFYELERRIVLQSIDELWMRHIDAMTRLREEVAFEGYAQRNPSGGEPSGPFTIVDRPTGVAAGARRDHARPLSQ